MSLLSSDALGHQALGAGRANVVGPSLGAPMLITGMTATLGLTAASAGAAVSISGKSSTPNLTLNAQNASMTVTTINAALNWTGVTIVPTVPDLTGTPADILGRIKKVLPQRWFAWVAPIRDAVLGALSDRASWCYGLIKYARAQIRLSTAYGIWLDVFAYDFLGKYLRRNGKDDDTFRAIIRATILQERVTRAGMTLAVKNLTGKAPWIFEPWNTYDTGGYSSGAAAYGSMGYGVGRGGYGNMGLPCQAFMLIHKGAGAGVPTIAGYSTSVDGYGSGAGEYVGPQSEQSGITNDMVYDMINKTKPSGTLCWTQVVV